MTLGDVIPARSDSGSRRAPTWLRVIAVLEPLSLAVLVLNLLTVDARGLAAALGPIHGLAYLAVIVGSALLGSGYRTTLLALVPALGGLLALRRHRRRFRTVQPGSAGGPAG